MAIAEASPGCANRIIVRYINRLNVVDAFSGPPPVWTRMMSKALAASMPRTISATAMTGRRSGRMIDQRIRQNPAPSRRPASMSSPGTFCRPANSTRVMNAVVSHTSGIDTENRTIFGSLSQPIALGSEMIPTRASRAPTMPELSISRNRHSRPATTGAIISG